jgi:S-adenosylmethionine:tRNA ribosyltransferase-isomerase
VALDDYDYGLPDAAIAQTPAEPRDAARLLVALGDTVVHQRVRDLPELIRPGDVMVVNETRVMPARLRLRKPTGGEVEVFLLERMAEGWTALVRPSRRIAPGTVLRADPGFAVEVGDVLDDGQRHVRLLVGPEPGAAPADPGTEQQALQDHGAVPLPPYITAPLADPDRYQTVYARLPGSVAAPTAGLHLTPEVLDRCRVAGAAVHAVDLAVGLDTFRPVTADRLEDHVMHSERYAVPAATLAACTAARAGGGRVLAVGTTAVRALESAAATGSPEGRTRLFIHGDYPFRLVDVLLTNFHMPRSTLLLLLDAFAGPRWRALYATALAEGYRFLSFGDAMLVDRGRR